MVSILAFYAGAMIMMTMTMTMITITICYSLLKMTTMRKSYLIIIEIIIE